MRVPRKRLQRPGVRARRIRLADLPVNRLIPNMLTVLALCAGLTAVLYAIQGHWPLSVLAIVAAAVLDALDGRVARLLRGSSRFGAELDSLSDFISFGVAPGLVMFFWSLQDAGQLGWIVVLIFAVCAALRLARFNVQSEGGAAPPWAGKFFLGVPAPAAAGLILFPLLLSLAFDLSWPRHPLPVSIVAITVALLMISRLPTYAFKSFSIPRRFALPALLLVGLFAALLATATWLTMLGVLVAYVVTMPLSWKSWKRMHRAGNEAAEHPLFVEIDDHDELHETGPAPGESESPHEEGRR